MVTRYRVTLEDQRAFLDDGRAALATLVARPGCLTAHLGPAVDDPTLWTLTTTWESVGVYRRALSGHEVKLVVVPLMYRAIDEPSAFEELVRWTPAGGFAEHETMRTTDGDRRRPAGDDRRGLPNIAGPPGVAPGVAPGR